MQAHAASAAASRLVRAPDQGDRSLTRSGTRASVRERGIDGSCARGVSRGRRVAAALGDRSARRYFGGERPARRKHPENQTRVEADVASNAARHETAPAALQAMKTSGVCAAGCEVRVPRARLSVALSPDGKMLAFTALTDDGRMPLWIHPLEGGSARATAPHRECDPALLVARR